MIGTEQPVTAFVSNIPAGTPDDLVTAILDVFGTVVQWRRLKEPSGALKPSGFVDYASTTSAVQAARLLPHIHLYAGSTKRLVFRMDSAIQPATSACEGEEGEVADTKAADCRVLEALASLFQQRRMSHAADSCLSLIKDIDRVSHSIVAVNTDDDFERAEAEWLKREERTFREYRKYMETCEAATEPNPEIEHLFRVNRKEFRHLFPDRHFDEHVRHIVDSIPTDTAALYSLPINWHLLSTLRLRRWLIKQRGLSFRAADTVTSLIAQRRSPEEMQTHLDTHNVVEERGETFVVRLWRWLILDTNLHVTTIN